MPHILYGAETEEDAQILIQEMTTTGDRLRAFDQLFTVPSRSTRQQLPFAAQGQAQMASFMQLWKEILNDDSSADVQILAAGDAEDALSPRHGQLLARAHAFVLSKASPIFAKQLREGKSSPKQLEVHGSASAVQAFLHLIYTGACRVSKRCHNVSWGQSLDPWPRPGAFKDPVWPDIAEVVAIARLAAAAQTWFVLPPLVHHMRCALSQFSFCAICGLAACSWLKPAEGPEVPEISRPHM